MLGLQPSGGSLTSPSQLAHLLAAQYRVFAPSLLVAIAGMVIAVRRLLGCYRDRDWRALRPQAVLFSWAAVAVLIVGFSNLRYPQYFALVLLPLYLLWWTEVLGMGPSPETEARSCRGLSPGRGDLFRAQHQPRSRETLSPRSASMPPGTSRQRRLSPPMR